METSETEIEMVEVIPEAQEADEAETTDAGGDVQDSELPDWAKDKLRKANNEAKNLRQRLKDQEPLVAAAQEAERNKMSELEREQADNTALRATLAQRDTELLQSRYQIPDEYREFIGEGTFEEKEARAAKVGQMVQSATPQEQRPPSERPVESLKPGASPSTPPMEDTSYPAAWDFAPSRD